MSTVATHPTYEGLCAGLRLGSRRARPRRHQGWPHQHRLALQRPHLPARAREQARAHLGGFRRQRQDVHLRRPACALKHHRGLPGQPGLAARREDLPLHGPRAGALHRLPRDPQDGRDRTAPVLRVRRGLAVHAPRRCQDLGDRDPEEAPREGAQDPREASRASAHRRRGRGRSPPAGPRGDHDPRQAPAGGEVRRLPLHLGDTVRPALHLGYHRPAQGRPARPLLDRLPVPDGQVGARPPARRRLLVQRRPGLGDRHLIRDHRPVVERHDTGGAGLGLLDRALVRVHRQAPRHGLVLGAHRDPPPDARRHSRSPRSTTSPRCGTCAAWANR